MHTVTINNCTLTLKKGDITCENVDVIVNAANRQLLPGGGVRGDPPGGGTGAGKGMCGQGRMPDGTGEAYRRLRPGCSKCDSYSGPGLQRNRAGCDPVVILLPGSTGTCRTERVYIHCVPLYQHRDIRIPGA